MLVSVGMGGDKSYEGAPFFLARPYSHDSLSCLPAHIAGFVLLCIMFAKFEKDCYNVDEWR